jgi:DNA sulfur modification protein DndE
MKLKYKIYLSKDVANRLSMVVARTKMQPNLLCRIGFCMSLREPSIPNPAEYAGDTNGREFNRYTLTGEWDLLFTALLRQRCIKDGLNLETDLDEQFAAHLGRGVILLFDRVKNLRELRRAFEPSFSLIESGVLANTSSEQVHEY